MELIEEFMFCMKYRVALAALRILDDYRSDINMLGIPTRFPPRQLLITTKSVPFTKFYWKISQIIR